MGKRRKTSFWILIITLGLIITIAGTGLTVLFKRPAVLFVVDPIYEDTSFSLQRRLELYRTTIQNGWFLKVERVGLDLLYQAEATQDTIRLAARKTHSPLLLLSPLVTSAVALGGPLYPANDGPLVVGMGADSAKGGFNIGLIAQEPDTGWMDAADKLQSKDAATPMPIAVLYTADDSQAASLAKAFIRRISSEKLVEFGLPSSAESARQAQSTLDKLLDLGVLIVACPFIRSLDLYVLNPLGEGLQWVVDESYRMVIPKAQLLGTIGDDLGASLAPVFDPAARKFGGAGTIILPRVRVYRE